MTQPPFLSADEAYRYAVDHVMRHGVDRGDRTGTGTRSVFNLNFSIDMSQGTLPVVSLKKTKWQDAIKEFIWMLSGSNSIVPLIKQGIHIWTDWPLAAYIRETGETISRDQFEARLLGDADFAAKWGIVYPCYGQEMRAYQSRDGAVVDQFGLLVDELKRNPESRRLEWSLWRPEYITIQNTTGLPPCHYAGALRAVDDTLDLKAKIRSNDIGLGQPYNVAQYGYFLQLLAAITGRKPGRLVVDIDDAHIYRNHLENLPRIFERASRPDPKFAWKRMPTHLDDNLSIDDFEVVGYEPQGFIPLPVAV